MFSIYITLLTSFANNTQVNMHVILTRLFGFNKLNFEDRHTRPSLALTPSLIITFMKQQLACFLATSLNLVSLLTILYIQRQRSCRQAKSKTKLAKSLKIMTIKDSQIVKALTCIKFTCTNKYDNVVKETYTSDYIFV